MRLFVAVELPGELRSLIGKLMSRLMGREPGAKWVAEENLHITLRFIGEVGEADAEDIRRALAGVRAEAFTVSVGELGGFPLGARRYRVIWLGVSQGAGELARLAREVNRALEFLGPERGEFHPHITLARARRGRELPRSLLSGVNPPEFSFRVRAFSLMRSTLRPEGPLYQRLEEYPLGSP